MKIRLALILLVTSIAFTPANASPTAEGEAEVRKTLAEFIQAFDNLDWDRFRNAFADDACVFYPREFPHRADGRAEFEKFFQRVFDHIRGNKTAPPYMDIQPKDLRVQMAGTVAVISFHLDDRPGFLNRRTVVLQKQAGGWKIIHLHASEVATPAQ